MKNEAASMEEKISYRCSSWAFWLLLFTAALCIFVFHRAFIAQCLDDWKKRAISSVPGMT